MSTWRVASQTAESPAGVRLRCFPAGECGTDFRPYYINLSDRERVNDIGPSLTRPLAVIGERDIDLKQLAVEMKRHDHVLAPMKLADKMALAGHDAGNAEFEMIAALGHIALDLAENHVGDLADGIDRHFMRDGHRTADDLRQEVAHGLKGEAKGQRAFQMRLRHADNARNVAHKRNHAFADFVRRPAPLRR